MLTTNKIVLQYLTLFVVFVVSFIALNDKSEFYIAKNKNKTATPVETPIISYEPDYVRGIYLTAYSAGSDEIRQSFIERMTDSRINSVVIDIKDYSGYILYDSQVPAVKEINGSKNRMPDVKKIIDEFHAIGVYVIARQTVFQDPVLASAKPELALKTYNGNLWYDNNGLAWLDPAKREVWEYNLAIAKEATALGFDEINFDYMRYPSDGNMAALNYNMPEGQTRASVLDGFFKFLSDNLTGETKISIDTFGLVLDNIESGYDLNIGQKLVELSDHFDYVCPMMYPSHYPLNYLGFANSAEHPGAVISYGLDISSSTMDMKRAKLRPWLQAFNIRAIYDKAKIDAQTEATENAYDTNGWLLWNARNYYPDHIF